MQAHCVFCVVRSEYLYKILINSHVKKNNFASLQNDFNYDISLQKYQTSHKSLFIFDAVTNSQMHWTTINLVPKKPILNKKKSLMVLENKRVWFLHFMILINKTFETLRTYGTD
jgi:hypothetical protein